MVREEGSRDPTDVDDVDEVEEETSVHGDRRGRTDVTTDGNPRGNLDL